MKTFKTDNIVIEMTREEIELLMSALNSASLRRREQGVICMAEQFSEMWNELYNILKELDK